ncbi:MAG: phosphoribosylformylglycinamidine synthase subunit PurQ [Bacteroidetes bacterium]|nr:phosphoribosylformylglycinamidine synthase subunit PurQ [Bacteroidota bacterium]
MKFGVVIFPGSNCDQDMIHVLENVLQQEVIILWHKEHIKEQFSTNDCIVIPGGFSYGDYLRAGAIARFSPVMKEVIEHGNNGGYVMGICNGFQVLCEAGLLPGVLQRNEHQQFVCKNIYIKSATSSTALTSSLDQDQPLKIPISHAEGSYFADKKTLDSLEKNDQIMFRYCDENGDVNDQANPNGSLNNIAGICNADRNVFGMMPHPERAAEEVLGNTDGRGLFESLLTYSEELTV